MSPPTDADCLHLRKLILTGFGDRVARRIEDSVGTVVVDDDGKQRLKGNKPGGSYTANGIDTVLTIHPSSVLFKEKPNFVMFQEITETSATETRVYLKLVTAIEPKWLPSICPSYCSFGDIAEEEAGQQIGPRFDSSKGVVVCHRKTTYSSHNWNLGLAEVEYPPGIDRIRWFARFFLEGKVIEALEAYSHVLLSAPVTVVKSWGRLQPRTELFVRTLYGKNVDSYQSLIAAWQDDSKCK